MTREDYLFVCAMEECAELAQRLAKAARFGMDQVQEAKDDRPDQNPDRLNNRQRIYEEFYDLRATLGLLGLDAWEDSPDSLAAERVKIAKVERYLAFSAELGKVQGPLDL